MFSQFNKRVNPNAKVLTALVLFFMVNVGYFSFAQDARSLDSLKHELIKNIHDTVEIKVLNQLANLAPDGEWEYYNQKCKKLLLTKKKYANKKEQAFYAAMLASTYNNEGLALASAGKIEQAIELYKKSLRLSVQHNDSYNSIITSTNLARQYYQKGDVVQSLRCFSQAFEWHEKTKDTVTTYNIAYANNFVGELYKDQGEPKQALNYYTRALSLFQKLKNEEGMAITFVFMGTLYIEKKQLPLAKKYFSKALLYFQKEQMQNQIASIYNNFGRVFLEEGKTDSAAHYLKKGLFLFEKSNYRKGLCSVYQNLGSTYFDKQDFDSARHCFVQAMAIAKELNYPHYVAKAAHGLYRVHKHKGEQKQALNMFELFVKLEDSLTSDQNKRVALTSQLKFEYRQKQLVDSLNAIAQQQSIKAELTKTKTKLYGLIFGVLFLVLLGVFVFQRLRFKQKEKEFLLRNKIASDLHDEVGSALSSISMYAGVARLHKQTETVHGLVEKIESTSRETLNGMGDIVWSLITRNDKLVDVFERIKKFNEPLFHAKHITVVFNLNAQAGKVFLNMQQKRNVYLIYKEAINNVLKYAGADQINVDVEFENRQLSMQIRDNGCGFDMNQTATGNGILNMRERAAELKGNLHVESTKGKGTSIKLLFKPA